MARSSTSTAASSGINTAVAGGANGIGFAVPIDDAAEIMAAAIGASQS